MPRLSTILLTATLALSTTLASAQTSNRSTAPPLDLRFMQDAARGNAAEVDLGRLALDRASSSQVREFAQRMVDDHSRAGDQLLTLAQSKSVSLGTQPNAEQTATLSRLSRLSGTAFDRAYMTAMVREHRKAVALFQREARNGTDRDVMAFATQMLPALRDHLAHAQQLASGKKAVSKK